MISDAIDLRLDGMVAIITGGGAGIGAATARLFARQGARVVVVELHDDAGRRTAAEIVATGGEALWYPTDVSVSAQVQQMVERTVERYGRVDVLVNNAGVGATALFWEMADEDWQRVIDVNLTGHFHCAKYVMARMIAQGGGAIINTASVLGYATMMGQAAYTASKAAIIGLTRAMALDGAARGVRVNCLAPGSTDTPMMWQGYHAADLPRIAREAAAAIPLGRVAASEEIARAALFLASPAAAYITGTTLIVDGGLLSRIATNY